MSKYFISAGDVSGDLHAAKLMREMRVIEPNAEFVGIGGREMSKQGFKSIVPLADISVVGFWEVAKKYRLFRELMDKCHSMLKNDNIRAFIPVDYPGFNLRLCEYAKSRNIPTIYYIAPQLWAWGKKRAAKLSKNTDKALVVFPFEEKYFQDRNINAKFVGHPLMDIPEFSSPFKKFEDRKNSIVMLAGSRNQEIIKHLPLLVRAAEEIKKAAPNYEICFAKSKSVNPNLFDSVLKTHPYIRISENSRQEMLDSKAGVIKTGTSNLEAAISGLPFSMYYIASFITYQMGKRLIDLKYISLINILFDDDIIKEFIQSDATPNNIAKETLSILNNPEKYINLQNKFNEIRNLLGGAGASRRAAEEIFDYLNNI
jgi:lipid-A-disaccharide synthase